jgi:hypothetical protein
MELIELLALQAVRLHRLRRHLRPAVIDCFLSSIKRNALGYTRSTEIIGEVEHLEAVSYFVDVCLALCSDSE